MIKLILNGGLFILLAFSSVSEAAMNPFKKSKNYSFGDDVPWYKHDAAAVKSGSSQNGSDTYYYHLIIDNNQLLLRLGKNDPSGELENTRVLEGLSIVQVRIDGQLLPLFNWCLSNQQNPSKKLKQNAVVANDVCINAGGGGDFVINIDSDTRRALRAAKQLVFIVEPYGRQVKLSYSMLGYASVEAQINKPVPPPVVKKPVVKVAPVAVVIPKPVSRPKPSIKPKPKPKPKPESVKMCRVQPPVEYMSAFKDINYPCKSASRKTRAQNQMAKQVASEKKKRAAELVVSNNIKLAKEQALEDNKRETEWDEKQATLWVSRCKRHWAKNRSPCYCEKYLNLAPMGIKNTCNK